MAVQGTRSRAVAGAPHVLALATCAVWGWSAGCTHPAREVPPPARPAGGKRSVGAPPTPGAAPAPALPRAPRAPAPTGLQIAAATDHVCAIRPGGRVACWGANNAGQLGVHDTRIGSSLAIEVPGVAHAVGLAVSEGYSCALLADRHVMCWGGALPHVVDGLADVTGIYAGGERACATLRAGGARCFDQPEPASHIKLEDFGPTAVITAMISDQQVGGCWCAVGADHQAWCTGFCNGNRENHGAFRTVDYSYAARMIDRARAGTRHGTVATDGADTPFTCALEADHSVRCQGRNNFGQLGDGVPLFRRKPVEVQHLSGEVTRIQADRWNTYALTRAGEIWHWGEGVPTSPQKLPLAPASDFMLTGEDLCTIGEHHALRCSSVMRPQRCDGSAPDACHVQVVPDTDLGPLPPALAVAIDTPKDVCVIDRKRRVRCAYRTGDGVWWKGRFLAVPGLHDVTELASSGNTFCAAPRSGGVRCWEGVHEDNVDASAARFDDVPYAGAIAHLARVKKLTHVDQLIGSPTSGSDGQYCARSGTTYRCWSVRGDQEPAVVHDDSDLPSGILPAVDGIQATEELLCARKDADVACEGWPTGPRPEFLDDAITHVTLPAPATLMATGEMHVCAATADHKVWCWGLDDVGQLGDGRRWFSTAPTAVQSARP
jgi:Regulator of chromosome condensation (RCC1) repeat